jgi:Polysaccharide pyruvyl transferase
LSPALVAAAHAILPRVDFIALREELCSKPLLQSLGVSTGRIMTTGDDAVEMAHRERPPQLGAGLGVNMRAADYSGVGRNLVDAVRLALHEAAGKRQIDLLPVPISRVPGEADAETIRMLLAGCGRTDEAMPDDVGSVIRQIARCRVVVTGSYHAGVFALSMGVPTIGLARSEYYVGKFTGLAGMFGVGCQVVMLNESDFPDKLSATIGRLCDEAEALRPQLLTQATRQVALGRAAYARFCSPAEGRRHRKRH